MDGFPLAPGVLHRSWSLQPSLSGGAVEAALLEHAAQRVHAIAQQDALVGGDFHHPRMQGALGRPAVPRRVAVVPDFPLLPNRKIDRASLRALATEPGRVTWLP